MADRSSTVEMPLKFLKGDPNAPDPSLPQNVVFDPVDVVGARPSRELSQNVVFAPVHVVADRPSGVVFDSADGAARPASVVIDPADAASATEQSKEAAAAQEPRATLAGPSTESGTNAQPQNQDAGPSGSDRERLTRPWDASLEGYPAYGWPSSVDEHNFGVRTMWSPPPPYPAPKKQRKKQKQAPPPAPVEAERAPPSLSYAKPPPTPPAHGTWTGIGLRNPLTDQERRKWFADARAYLDEVSRCFSYVSSENMAAWILFDWPTDDQSKGSDMFEGIFGERNFGTTRAEGLGITNLRPKDLLFDTNATSRLLNTPGVPEDIKQLARKAIRSEDQYRYLLSNDDRFSFFILGAAMQSIHESLRREFRHQSPEFYEKHVVYAIESNLGTRKEIADLAEAIRNLPPTPDAKLPGIQPPFNLDDFAK